MKRIFLSLFLTASLTSCNDSDNVVGSAPSPSPGTSQTPATSGIVYGNYFSSVDSTAYQELLESCNRCGRKWISQNQWGGTSYHKCSWLSSHSPLKCRNWSSKGYLQIEFAEQKLPTTAVVTVWPQYSYRTAEKWGQSFAAEGQAQPVNENKGFSVVLPPASGIGGLRTLYVESEHTNHINGGHLDVDVRYGGGQDSDIMLSVNSMPQVKKNPPAQYSCRQRPPDLLSTGSVLSLCISFSK